MTETERAGGPGDPLIVAPDRRLEARIVARTPLLYAEGACADQDRPAHVRAGSGAAFLGDDLVVVQDDANFLALCRPGQHARAVALPRGPGGRRVFDDGLGNKLDKLDLEACFVAPAPRGQRLIALGSGSLPARETIIIFDRAADLEVRTFDGAALYAALRAEPGLSGAELNVEGAALVGDALRLFDRGNGRGGGPATVDIDAGGFLRWLDGLAAEPPALGAARRYDLGAERGVRYGFTDATAVSGDRVLFLACAEDSPDVVRDGEVIGARVGWLEGDQGGFTPLLDEAGAAAAGIKPEGIALDPERPDRVWLVLEPDDADRPSDLCEVVLDGPWRS